MDKFLERFNSFDLFAMLIPGMGITTLFSISLSAKYYYIWENCGNEKYLIFFMFSYFCGVIFQEIGAILDKKYLYNALYGGDPREIFLLRNKNKKIINEDIFYDNILAIKNYFVKNLDAKSKRNLEKATGNIINEDLSSIIFGYCINMAENLNLEEKPQKMIIISDMSRSLFWGCIATIFLNIFMVFINFHPFYIPEIIALICMSRIFLKRKIRYERYRIRILLRTIYLYLMENRLL